MLMRRVFLALLLSALVFLTLPAFAESSARIVRLSYLDGNVQVDRGAGQGLERAILNLPVTQGMQVITGKDGTAEIEFEDGSTLRLVPNTSVNFARLALRDDGRRISSVELRSGTAYLESNSKRDEYTVAGGGQQIAVTHPARVRITRNDPDFRVAVFKGEADVVGNGDSVHVKKDETLSLDLDDSSRYQLAKGIDSESYDTWARERDTYRSTYASNHHDNYDSAYSYGWSDLNYFGNFFSLAGYGPLWQPYGMGPYWDPFSDGAWVWYPGYGYTWVSAYPWGWMPYRYGTWLFVPGYGWCWRPATYWNTWTVMPVVTSPPPGYIVPHPPSTVRSFSGTGAPPRTIAVGRGPVDDMRDPRVERWMAERQQAAPVKNTAVTPVPVKPASTTAATTTSGSTKASTTTTTTTTSKPQPSSTIHNRRVVDEDRTEAAPRTEQPTTTTTPAAPAQRTSPSPTTPPAPRSAPPPRTAPAPRPTTSWAPTRSMGGSSSFHSSVSSWHR